MLNSIKRFLLHLHPPRVEINAIKLNRTFGLGGMSVFLVSLLALTGILLRFVYVPDAEKAYRSIELLNHFNSAGRLIRNIHYWSATILCLFSVLHLLRVLFSQAIYFERKKNWYYGLVLMFLVFAFCFTGYLLPWDQVSYWAVTVVANVLRYFPVIGDALASFLLDGRFVSEHSLLRFYHLHTGVLPVLLFMVLSIHIWLVRKAKGVAIPQEQKGQLVNTSPHLVYKELVALLILIIAITTLSIFFNAPLSTPANLDRVPEIITAPWYFAGMQELLLHIHPLVGGILLPIAFLIFLIVVPKMGLDEVKVGVWFNGSRQLKKLYALALIFSVLLTVLLVVLSDAIIKDSFNVIWGTVFMVSVYFVTVSGFLIFLLRNLNRSMLSISMIVFVLFTGSYITLTIIGLLRDAQII